MEAHRPGAAPQLTDRRHYQKYLCVRCLHRNGLGAPRFLLRPLLRSNKAVEMLFVFLWADGPRALGRASYRYPYTLQEAQGWSRGIKGFREKFTSQGLVERKGGSLQSPSVELVWKVLPELQLLKGKWFLTSVRIFWQSKNLCFYKTWQSSGGLSSGLIVFIYLFKEEQRDFHEYLEQICINIYIKR